MDNYCFICDKIIEEDTFLVCNNHLEYTCRKVVGLLYVSIGVEFNGQGLISDDDNIPVTDSYPNITSFVESMYNHMMLCRNMNFKETEYLNLEEEEDMIFGRCPVLLVQDSYTITEQDLNNLEALFSDLKPFIVYQKTRSINISNRKNWISINNSLLDPNIIIEYWTVDKNDNYVNIPLMWSSVCTNS